MQVHNIDLAGKDVPWQAIGQLDALEELSLWNCGLSGPIQGDSLCQLRSLLDDDCLELFVAALAGDQLQFIVTRSGHGEPVRGHAVRRHIQELVRKDGAREAARTHGQRRSADLLRRCGHF